MKKQIIFVFFVVVLLVVVFFAFSRNKSIGGLAASDVGDFKEDKKFDISKVVFKSEDGKDVYALFFKPSQPKGEKFNVVIVLPGAEGTKESRSYYGEMLAWMGYGAFILDQRGIGETGGVVAGLQEDFQKFLKGKEGDQFLMVKDVLSGVDFLDGIAEVDEISVLGESMGARYGIIAAALDERIKAVIVISSAGFLESLGSDMVDNYLAYINPNTYIGMISPRRILMLHVVNDSVIPIEHARYTFSLANEPKEFVEFDEEECNHGYCEPMRIFIEKELGDELD